MKKTILLFTLLIAQFCFAQNEEILSISFENKTLLEAFNQLEKQTNITFYYDIKWLENQDKVINSVFEEKTLNFILTNLVEETTLNFLIIENRIIISNNNVIYKLSDGYFKENQIQNNVPIIYNKAIAEKESKSDNTLPYQENRTYVVGKENRSSKKNRYKFSGVVIDHKSKQPLAYTNIKVSNSKDNFETITDLDGYYEFMLPKGVYDLAITSMGFTSRNHKIIVYNDGTQNFNLVEDLNELQEVVIKSESKETLRSAVTGVTKIDIEDVKTVPMVLGERDVLKVATVIPGIKTAGEGSAGFNVRGGKTDQNLILLDNGVIYNPFHFFGFFSAVNPYLVGTTSIYKGSTPAEFGGRLSSVFDIQTEEVNTQKFTGEGGIGPVTSNLTANIPIVKGKSALMVGGRATYSNWILQNLDNEELKDSEASFYDALLKYQHQLNEKNSIETTGYYSHDKFNISTDSLYKYENSLIAIKWDHSFNDNHKSALMLNNSNYKFGIDYKLEDVNGFNLNYNINETQLKIRNWFKLNTKHQFTYGISGKYYQINPGELNPAQSESLLIPRKVEDEQALETALFIADEYKINDKLSVNLGLRFSSYFSLGQATQNVYQEGLPRNEATFLETQEFDDLEVIKNYNALEYRFSTRYYISQDLSVKGSFDTNTQYIHLLSTNTTQSPIDTWKLSDLNIQPQSSQQFGLGIYKNLKNDTYQVSLEGYYKKIKNILDYKVGAELLMNESIETEVINGDGKAYGIEFLLKKTEGKLNGWLGYTYSRTFIQLDSPFAENRVNDGDFFPANFDKPHDFSLILNYKLTKRFSFSSNFIYQTGRPITYPVGVFQYGNSQYTLYSDRNEFRIPDYYRLDLGINIEGNHKINKLAHSFWNISVYNVLGRNNPYSIYFANENGQVKGYQTSIFAIPVPTITYNFKF